MNNHYDVDVRLDIGNPQHPQLVVAVPLEQTESIRDALATLARHPFTGTTALDVILDALRTAAEQSYFWTPEWQQMERNADLALSLIHISEPTRPY